jgi:hypothetical protein
MFRPEILAIFREHISVIAVPAYMSTYSAKGLTYMIKIKIKY